MKSNIKSILVVAAYDKIKRYLFHKIRRYCIYELKSNEDIALRHIFFANSSLVVAAYAKRTKKKWIDLLSMQSHR
jgi:hypothetical protein